MRPIDADALLERPIWFCGGWIGDSYAEGYMDALDKVEEAIKSEPTIEMPHWIPCDERLPELDEICLVTEKDRSIRHCYFDSADPVLFATVEEGMYVRNVIAWMPLPKPYTERKGDETT